MVGARSPFCEGTKAILPYKIGHMASLNNSRGHVLGTADGVLLEVFLQPEEEQIMRLGDIVEQFKAVVGRVWKNAQVFWLGRQRL